MLRDHTIAMAFIIGNQCLITWSAPFADQSPAWLSRRYQATEVKQNFSVQGAAAAVTAAHPEPLQLRVVGREGRRRGGVVRWGL